jgi:hypothetical protein
VDFDPRVRLEFKGTQLSSDGGLLVMRELDDALGLSGLVAAALRLYNQRGTAEQHIKEGKHAFHWTRLSCRRFRDNEVGCTCTRWLTTWPPSCAASSGPRKWPTGR